MLISKEELMNLYIKQGLSQSDIGKLYNVSSKNINYYVRKYNLKGLKGRIKFPINDTKVDVSNPIFNYVAGLVATDGHINYSNNRICIRVNNEGADITLQNILNYFECNNKVAYYKTGYEIRITSKYLIEGLESLNVKGTDKTYTLQVPHNFYNEDCLRLYLRGVLDGDGNIHLTKSKYTQRYVNGQFRIVTASKLFIEGLSNILDKHLNIKCPISKAKVNGVIYPKLELSVSDSKKFYNFIYKGFEDFRFQDKYEKYLKLKRQDEEIV